MKINHIEITNFRGIRSTTLPDLQNMVVIAGQNGSGKSCVLDAIRLLKSVYGGYQQNEWHHWMNEFQINFSNSADLATLMNDANSELRIHCQFSIHSHEREYLREHGEDLVRQSVWRTIAPELYAWSVFSAIPLAAQLRGREQEIQNKVEERLPQMIDELTRDYIVGQFTMGPDLKPKVTSSNVLEVIFGSFRPHFLGVVDYHGPHRMYGREQLAGINLNLDQLEQQRSQHALYNYVNKYANVKSEMAGSYIKEILAGQAGTTPADRESLSNTLKELFRTFFPDKEFLGPQPTPQGNLRFPVRTSDGSTHDLNELSAGEKEVLYGYLRLRNSAPRYSVILLDEPELHLNPRLVRGLPVFYHRHLGTALQNQIWLITHSDALLREAVGRDDYSVFHMQSANLRTPDQNQATPLSANEGVQRAVIDLVGDLASFRPDAKLIIFEGENSEFDQRMTGQIFPMLQQSANMISAGNKRRVKGLHSVLAQALETGQIPMRVFSIVDSDSEELNPLPDSTFSWNVYHIENYLLEPEFVLKVTRDIGVTRFANVERVYEELRSCARETLPDLVRHRLASDVNAEIISAIDTSTDRKAKAVAVPLSDAVQRSLARITKLSQERFDLGKLTKMETKLRTEYEKHLASDVWRKKFRGRDILSRYVGKIKKTNYEVFRDLVIAAMRDAGFQPRGMKSVIDRVLKA